MSLSLGLYKDLPLYYSINYTMHAIQNLEDIYKILHSIVVSQSNIMKMLKFVVINETLGKNNL